MTGKRFLTGAFAVATALCLLATGAVAQEVDIAKLEKQRSPQPKEFASVFTFGYGGDHMPKDDAKFEELLKTIKDLGFTVIHTTYTDKRLELCKKHGIKLMLDYLSVGDHHVYKGDGVPKAAALAEKLRGNPDVWGYNIYNDMFGKRGAGRRRDINTVRKWDPTHPAYCGTYRTYGARHLVNADIMGYYDFHWSRGIGHHFGNSRRYMAWAQQRNCIFYTFFAATSGQVGSGNINRTLWSANTGMAFGLKGALWFLATAFVDPKTLAVKPAAEDIKKVHAEMMPLKAEIMKIGIPTAVYGTNATKDMNDKPIAKPGPAGGLPAVPADCLVQPQSGEFIFGVFKDDQKRDAIFVANFNAYAPQAVKLKLAKPVKASLFDRKAGEWKALAAAGGVISFPLQPGGGELIRFE